MSRKKTRRAPARQITDQTYSLMDEMMASTSAPLPPEATSNRANLARLALESLRNGHGTRFDWEMLATVCNMFEVMLKEELVQDPDGLHHDCEATLIRKFNESQDGIVPALEGLDYRRLQWMVTDWEECMLGAHARYVIRAFRLTDANQRATSNGMASAFLRRLTA